MTDSGASTRPTRRRLYASLGISALSIAAMLSLLGSLIEHAGQSPTPGLERGKSPAVFIKTRGRESAPEPLAKESTTPAASTSAASAAAVDRTPQVAVAPEPDRPLQPQPQPQPTRDWHAMTKAAASSSVDEYYRNEESRAALWRETHSIMFEPASDLLAQEEAPVLRGFRFKPEIHVFGLGVTIGSCFIGLPLIGVPIEQRTIAINLFVCAKEADKPLG